MDVRFISILLSAVVATPAQNVQVQRVGEYWVQVTSGTVALPARSLHVHTRGPATVQGVARASSARYVLTRRVRAGSETEARRLLSELRLRESAAGTLVMTYPARPRASAELAVEVPSGLGRLLLESHSGDLQVYDIAGTVEARSGAGVIQMDRIGGEAVARTAGGEIRIGHVGRGLKCVSGGGSIQVGSAGGESWFDTAGGEINLGSIRGPIHASTAGGNIHIGRAGDSVAARTSGGRIEVQEAHGIVMAANSGGSIQVGSAQGVRLEATGGSIRLRGSGGALRAVSDSGNIFAELNARLPLRDSNLATGGGDITVFIPSDIPLTVQALNESARPGRIVSEFSEIPVREADQSRSAMLAEGALNGGGPVLKLTSTGGTIYLRRVRQ
jgi:DUF4097 and DUF4098 domain-containing protein YvlB